MKARLCLFLWGRGKGRSGPLLSVNLDTGSGLEQGWNRSFWQEIGLGDLITENFRRIGTHVLPPGTPVGDGLEGGVAGALGLVAGTPVGTAIIDAHAGGLG